MRFCWSNNYRSRKNRSSLPIVGLDIERWFSEERLSNLPGIHITISWKRSKFVAYKIDDYVVSVERNQTMGYENILVIELNWPRIWFGKYNRKVNK